METLEEIQDAIDEILAENYSDEMLEILTLTEMAERQRFFAKFRELIGEKEQLNDDIAASVLGWAYEQLISE